MLWLRWKGILEHRMGRTWSLQPGFYSVLFISSSLTLSLGLTVLVCKLWALIENQGPNSWHPCYACPSPWQTSLRGHDVFSHWAQTGHWNPFQYGALGSPLVLEMKSVYCLDETTWTWTPLCVMVWILPFKEFSHQLYCARPLLLTGLLSFIPPYLGPCSSLCLTTHFFPCSSGTNSHASPV